MKRMVYILVLVVILLTLVGNVVAAPARVGMCHNPGQQQQPMMVPAKNVDKRIQHGDTLGWCIKWR